MILIHVSGSLFTGKPSVSNELQRKPVITNYFEARCQTYENYPDIPKIIIKFRVTVNRRTGIAILPRYSEFSDVSEDHRRK